MRVPTTSVLALWATISAAASIPYRRQHSYNTAESLYFPVNNATLRNARVGEQYSASVGGLALGQANATAQFQKTGGAGWLQVSTEGILSGTPGQGSVGQAEITVQATADAASPATIRVTVPVRSADQALLEELAVMSYNMWQGGSNVNNYHEKQLRFVLESGADVIGLQESIDGGHAERLGNALGWSVLTTDDSSAIISRYPVVEEYGEVNRARGVRINLNGEGNTRKEINFWNTHLTSYPYGPYGFCFDNNTPEQGYGVEAESGRTGQMGELLDAMATQIANSDSVPVLLTGDMNAPSHLDWVESLREQNCGIADFDWPTSVLPSQAGLIDSYRVAHPDPVAMEGTTWSPVYPFNEGTTGDPEPQDRIDFVYATQQLEVISSETIVVGDPQPVPNTPNNEWTTDHAVVLTRFQLR